MPEVCKSKIEMNLHRVDGGTGGEEDFLRGLALFHRDEFAAALVCFRAAHAADPDHSRARSYLGVCVGICERSFEESVALCTSASKQEFFNPEVYLNLARVYLHFGFKTEGRRFLLRGQMIDPANTEISIALRRLGKRKDPVLRFLPRRHFINRWLGSARYLIGSSTAGKIAA